MNEHLEINEINELPFVFIVAKGRSGTTLLQSILDANEQVILPVESKLIIHLKSKYLRVKNWNDKKITEFLNDLYKETKFASHWHVERNSLEQTIRSYPPEHLSFQVLCKIIYLSYNSISSGGPIVLIGDKNPIYSMFVEELREVFPNAKFLHIVRDFRDNILSNLTTFGMESIASISAHWVEYNRNIEQSKSKLPNLFMTLRYEDLVRNPEKLVKEVCLFLGIPFRSEMLTFNEKINNLVAQGSTQPILKEMHQVQPNIVQPISTIHTEKWRRGLDQKQIKVIEFIAGDFAKKYGYNISDPNNMKPSFHLRLQRMRGRFAHKYKMLVVKTYYLLPMWLRDIFRWQSMMLYKTFGWTNYYNKADFRNTEKSK